MKTTEEKNRMIAEFMGIEFNKIGERFMASPTPNEIGSCWENQLKYHTSWDWLMPVVKKCAEESTTSYQRDRITFALLSMDIEKMYNAVVQFIEWYNENKKEA